jgi:hypothetical protein
MKSRMLALACSAALAGTFFLGVAASSPAVAASSPLRGGLSVPAGALPALGQLTQQQPALFGGVYQAGGTVYVDYAQSQAAAGTAALSRFLHQADGSRQQLGQQLRVVTRAVPYSLAQLNQVMARVWTARPWAALARPLITSWYADPVTDKVLIGATQITPALRQAARAAFGPLARLTQGQRAYLETNLTRLSPRALRTLRLVATRTTPTRLLDKSPYFGGDRIVRVFTYKGDTYVDQCTVGFAWSTGTMSTAGHCSYPSGGVGTKWLQGYYDSSNNTIYYTGTMGDVVKNIFGANVGDAALIGKGSYDSYVYTSSTGYKAVGAYSGATKGEKGLCADGSFTGQNCTGTVGAVNMSVSVKIPLTGQTFVIEHLDEVTSSTRLVQAGDSGGPCYNNVGNDLEARGIISAGTDPGTIMWMSDLTWMTSTSGLGGHPAL